MARKAQNSILLLTTLGVYIGLLVAGGAAPQVLAHSATTRNFEITDEIEVKDDLDKDPFDCSENASERALQLLNLDFLSDGVIDLIKDLDALSNLGKFSWSERFDHEVLRKVSEGGNARSSITSNSGNQWTQLAVSDKAESIASLCHWNGCTFYQYDNEFRANASTSKLDVSYNGDGLLVSISLSQRNDADARELSAIYTEALNVGSCSDIYARPSQQIIYKHTVSKPGNGQVLVVTSLPRGSLDSLLAKDAK